MGLVKPKLECGSHSNFSVVLEDGTVKEFLDMACYATLWGGYEGMKELYLWFPKVDIKGLKEYVNWLLNSDIFGGAFITKDFDSGMQDGFKVDINQPTNYIFMCMAALRFPWECVANHDWNWGKFFEDGFTEIEALFLTTNYFYEDGYLNTTYYNSNHLPIPRDVDISGYTLNNFKKQASSMFVGGRSVGVYEYWKERYPLLRKKVQLHQIVYNVDEIKKILCREGEKV